MSCLLQKSIQMSNVSTILIVFNLHLHLCSFRVDITCSFEDVKNYKNHIHQVSHGGNDIVDYGLVIPSDRGADGTGAQHDL